MNLLTTLVNAADEYDAQLQTLTAAQTDDVVIYALNNVGRALATLKAAAQTALTDSEL
jgi:hypothetical protein